jgi:5-hydroxyisourate hydrolase-like protein (transthyretin family)
MRAFRGGTVTARALALVLLVPAAIVAGPSSAGAVVADAPSPATELQATADFDEVKLSWNPGIGTVVTEVRGKAGAAAPTGIDDGFPVGLDTSILPTATASNLDPGQPYTFAVFACSAIRECAAPAVVTVGSLTVNASVSPGRIIYGDEVTISGTVVDTLTGVPAENVQIRLVGHRLTSEEGELLADDVSHEGGTFTFTVAPPEQAEFAVVARGDAAHLGGLGLTRTVGVSALAILEQATKKGKLGTTFVLIGAAGPIHTGLPLILQEKVGKKWKTVLKKKPNREGLAKLKVKPTTKGKHVYRLTKAKTPGVGPGTSKSVTITVT